MKRIISFMLILAMLTLCLTGCGPFGKILKRQPTPTPEPEPVPEPVETIEEMLARCNAACNAVDLEGILDCVSPKLADPLRLTLKLASSLGGKSEEELLDQLIGMLAGAETTDSWQVCQTLDAEVVSIQENGDEAQVALKFSFEQDGEQYTGETTATCVRIDGRWYISKLSV